MASYLRGIADALAEGLGNVDWSIESTTVERRNWAAVDADNMYTPRVLVVPGNATTQRVSRDMVSTDYTVNVFVGRHVSSDSDVDGMLDLADEVLLQVKSHDFPGVTFPSGVTSPQTVTIDIDPDEALVERNMWRAVIGATYIVFGQAVLPTPS